MGWNQDKVRHNSITSNQNERKRSVDSKNSRGKKLARSSIDKKK